MRDILDDWLTPYIFTFVVAIFILLGIGFIWGVNITSNSVCRQLGYESGNTVDLIHGGLLTCQRITEAYVQDMWLP